MQLHNFVTVILLQFV